ncbi:hypothetical protein ABGB12_22230 [Actinocorallia sp. B10E7]|uniref:hypothetical protein n=1 Tax=Actinocorallia sp. B10E7 TaxID=3153558 RepID=UPI00325E6C4E
MVAAIAFTATTGTQAAMADPAWQTIPPKFTWPVQIAGDFDAGSAQNAWIVGGQGAGFIGVFPNVIQFQPKPVLQHWNGSSWTSLKAPGISGEGLVKNVSVGSPSSTWILATDHPENSSLEILARWNGSTWNHFTAPSLGAQADYFEADAQGAWVGHQGSLVLHRYDNTGASTTHTFPAGVWGFESNGSDDAWASGDNFVSHWDGTSWTTQTWPDDPNRNFVLTPVGFHEVWATRSIPGGNEMIRWDGSQWQAVPVPVGVNTWETQKVVKAGGALWVETFRGSEGGPKLLKFNGTAFVETTGFPAADADPENIVATSDGRLYVAGGGDREGWLARLDGTQWTRIADLPYSASKAPLYPIPGTPSLFQAGHAASGAFAAATNAL